MKILLPNNHKTERRYTLDVLLGTWLGLIYEIHYTDIDHTELLLANGGKIIFEDHFFNSIMDIDGWATRNHLPINVNFQPIADNPFLPELDMPILFGNGALEVTANTVICGHDALAAAFFMLTRWEESVQLDRDEHQRFPAKESLAYKFGFLHRPFVNEICEMLWNMLKFLEIDQDRLPLKPSLRLTHDVDEPLLWTSPLFFLKKLGGDILKRHDAAAALFSVSSYYSSAFHGMKDPYDTFEMLMTVAENVNLSAYFFFMSGGGHKLDPPSYLHQHFIQKLFQRIKERGHHIGFHPSYETYNDESVFAQEKMRLENACGQAVKVGRQHFLRFQAPDTWRIWANQGMEWDSTLAYAEQVGFRCGSCLAFPVFDCQRREALPLMEYPLTAMEGSLRKYQNLPPNLMLAKLNELWATTQKYGGTFTLLWHNSAFNTPYYMPYHHIYKHFVTDAIKSNN